MFVAICELPRQGESRECLCVSGAGESHRSRDESVSPCCRAAARYKLVHTLIRIDRSGMQEEVGFVGTQYNQAVSIFTGESSGISSSSITSPTSRSPTLTRRTVSRIHRKWKAPAPSNVQLHGRSSAVTPPDPLADRRDPERTHRLEQQDPIVLLVPVLLYDVVRARQVLITRTRTRPFPALALYLLQAHLGSFG